MSRAYAAFALLLGLALALAACAVSRLPDYGRGSAQVRDAESVDMSDVIPYRALVREDFRAPEVPELIAAHRDQVGAFTAVHIRTREGLRIRMHHEGSRYTASVHGLHFEAVMDRKGSWWNAEGAGLPADYVLEHEQIHFALAEIEVGAMNARLGEIAGRLATRARSVEGATEGVNARLRDELERAGRAFLARSDRFDEETSFGVFPEPQRVWKERVERELAATRSE